MGHVRGSHRQLNVKCGVNGCDELVSSISWYKHVRFHHRAEYYFEISAEPEYHPESELPAHETVGDLNEDSALETTGDLRKEDHGEKELSDQNMADDTENLDSQMDYSAYMLTASFFEHKKE